MFYPGYLDTLTLNYIRKSMPADKLAEAEAAGIFDNLQKGLHPQKVLCHGPHGPYYATRMVSDGQDAHGQRMPKTHEDEKKPSSHSVADDIKKYSGRQMKDIYAEEGKEGVMKALGAQYAKEGADTPSYQMDRLEEFYGHSDNYTPEAAARAMQFWTKEKLRIPETEGMDEEELEDWYNESSDAYSNQDSDGMMWACSLIRQVNSGKIDTDSESEITASVCGDILNEVIDRKGKVYDQPLYRGVVMPEGTVEDLINGGDVDLGGISSFTRSDGVALSFIERSPVWDSTEYESDLPEKIVFITENTKSYKVEQSEYSSEQEHLVKGDKPFSVSRIALDSLDGDDVPNDIDEEELEDGFFYADHTFYVYLEEKQ